MKSNNNKSKSSEEQKIDQVSDRIAINFMTKVRDRAYKKMSNLFNDDSFLFGDIEFNPDFPDDEDRNIFCLSSSDHRKSLPASSIDIDDDL